MKEAIVSDEGWEGLKGLGKMNDSKIITFIVTVKNIINKNNEDIKPILT